MSVKLEKTRERLEMTKWLEMTKDRAGCKDQLSFSLNCIAPPIYANIK